jgi:indole-3-glycerol phosphate synthase
MSILQKIVERKRERLNSLKARISLSKIKSMASRIEKLDDFQAAVKRVNGRMRLIAEIKKASPLRGSIRKDFDPLIIASVYDKKNVDAISVLTEEDYFQGKLEYVERVKRITTKPILRKDFIFDEYQIYESKAYRADAILLVASILDRNQAADYLHLSNELGLSVLFEVHDFRELETALVINADIIGINNRNLKTLDVDFNTTLKLKNEIPPHKVIVSESGIKTRIDVLKLEDAGVDAILVGTVFMEAGDIEKKIDELLGMQKV